MPLGNVMTGHDVLKSMSLQSEASVLRITPEERAVLQLLAGGKSTRDIASHLGTLESDIDERLARLFARMGVSTLSQAVAAASKRGLA